MRSNLFLGDIFIKTRSCFTELFLSLKRLSFSLIKLHLLQSVPSLSRKPNVLFWCFRLLIGLRPQKTAAFLFPGSVDLDKPQDVIPLSPHRRSCELGELVSLSSEGAILPCGSQPGRVGGPIAPANQEQQEQTHQARWLIRGEQ